MTHAFELHPKLPLNSVEACILVVEALLKEISKLETSRSKVLNERFFNIYLRRCIVYHANDWYYKNDVSLLRVRKIYY